MFSRKSSESENSTDNAEPEVPEVVTGEEVVTEEDVSVDPEAEYVDPSDLVGQADAPPVAEEEDFSGFEETVSLPTGRSAPAEVTESSVEEHEGTDYDEQPEDVLANRDIPAFLAEDTTVQTTQSIDQGAAEETQVLRRSLIATPDETVVEESLTQEPTAPQPVREAPHADFAQVDANRDTLMLAGATVLPSVGSKAPARWLSLIGTLILVPVAWYLLSDASARLAFADANPMMTGNVNLAALAELFGGLVFVALIAVLAAQSSLGLFVSGALLTLVGLPFLVVPAWTNNLVDQYLEGLRTFNDFGSNVVAHFLLTGYTGVLVMAGIGMILAGWVIYAVRRSGRREESMRVMVAATNPEGLQARWARKATERDRQGQ